MQNMREKRLKYLMKNFQNVKYIKDLLKDAPMTVRKLGLPMALALWSKNQSKQQGDRIRELVADWLFSEWGVINVAINYTQTQNIINELLKIEEKDSSLRSYMEIEAEQLLNDAKILSDI